MTGLNHFSSRVNEEKMNRIGNLQDVIRLVDDERPEVSQSDIVEFFEVNGINPSTIRDFLQKHISLDSQYKEVIVEWMITHLSLNEWKQEIIQEIIKRWPFKNPKELSHAIAEYIQSKMPYDGIAALQQIVHVLKNSGTWIENEVLLENSSGAENIIAYLRWLGIHLSDNTIENLKNSTDLQQDAKDLLIQWIRQKNIVINEHHMKLFSDAFQKVREKFGNLENSSLLEFEKIIHNNDVQWFSDYIFRESARNDSDMFKILVGEFVMLNPSILTLWNQKEVYTMLSEVKTGVCRHYAMIMREIYNEMMRSGEGILFNKKETEMIYVLNQKRQHAYNVLLSEDMNGELKKDYLDVTRFIMWKHLFSEEKNAESRNQEEIWASVHMDENRIT